VISCGGFSKTRDAGDFRKHLDKKSLYKKNTVYLDEALGFKGNNALRSVRLFFNKNWNRGLHYNGAKYYGLNSGNVGTNINYNFKTKTQYKLREKDGYGYNCTGVVTSVLYYASKTKKSFGKYYKRLIDGQGIGKICNGFYWWYFFNNYNVKKYCAGRVSNKDDVNRVLNKAPDLQTGYVIYFSPTVRGGDCHLGFYWGKDHNGDHMMRHCIWRGFEWSNAFPGARGTYDLYVIPLSHGKTGTFTKTFNVKLKRKVKSVYVTKEDGGESKIEEQTEKVTKETESQSQSETSEQIETESSSEVEIPSEVEISGETEIENTPENFSTATVTKKALSLRGDSYGVYGVRSKKGLSKKITTLRLNKKGETYKTLKIKVKLRYENGKLIKHYISSIGGKKLSKNRHIKNMFWIRELKSTVPEGYKNKKTTYCFKVEKYKKNKIKLSLYKSNTKKKNKVKSIKAGRTMRVNVGL